MAVAAGVLGVSVGICAALPNMIIVKYMGVENHPATRGAVAIFSGPCLLLFGSLIGRYIATSLYICSIIVHVI